MKRLHSGDAIQWMTGALVVALGLLSWAFATRRVPYDDELFTLGLVQLPAERFWWGLARDVHPPWLAMSDRFLLAGSEPLMRALRAACTAGAAWLLSRTFAPRWKVPPWAFALGMLHPVVLYYGASVRWYPVVLIAQAMRARAVWSDELAPRQRGLLFALGAALGPACGYVDVGFVVLDLAWWAGRAPSKGWRRGAAGAAVAAVLLGILASPLGLHVLSTLERRRSGQSTAFNLVRWLPGGLAGEAMPAWPWALVGLVPAAAFAAVLVVLVRREGRAGPGVWLATQLAAWAAACRFGVWSPRYSLLPWMLLVAGLFVLAGTRWQWLARGAGAVLALSVGLTFTGRFFVKADLNTLPAQACAQLVPDDRDVLLAIPYGRLAGLVERTCRPQNLVVRAPHPLLVEDRGEPARAVVEALPGHRAVWLETALFASGSLEDEQRAIRERLRERCVPVSGQELLEDRWSGWKQRDGQLLRVERFACGPP